MTDEWSQLMQDSSEQMLDAILGEAQATDAPVADIDNSSPHSEEFVDDI